MYVERNFQLVNRADRPDLARGDRRIHYLHVPKCGGTTLRYVLEAFAATRGLSSANEARRIGERKPDLSAAKIVMGHEHPSEGLTHHDTCYFTVLRDPVQRLRSLAAMFTARLGMDPDRVVRELTWTQANWAVHLLTGATGPEGDPVSRAKQALQSRIHLFGFQEQFDEFMTLVAAMLEIDGLIYPAFQHTPAGLRWDGRFDTAFAEMAEADRALYQFARELYRERFAAGLDPETRHRRTRGRTYLTIRIRPDEPEADVSEIRFA